MKSCIAQIIEELQGRIAEFNGVIEALRKLEPGSEVCSPSIHRDGNGNPARSLAGPRPSRTKPVTNTPAKAGSRRLALEQARRMLAAAATAAEPLTGTNLAKAAGLADDSRAEAFLYRWLAKGWVLRSGKGEYKRTSLFPKSESGVVATPATSGRLSIPGLDPEPLQTRLERAKAELNVAMAKGQTTLVDILRHKIKKLERDAKRVAA